SPRMPALKIQPICILSSANAWAIPTAAIPAACKSSPQPENARTEDPAHLHFIQRKRVGDTDGSDTGGL
ncbi:hypothetical protein KHP62_22985, partial [Rhodobacteraceae bacterium NNCM2]|nr:hypothetical protein [Coraliihabitans acroporae]